MPHCSIGYTKQGLPVHKEMTQGVKKGKIELRIKDVKTLLSKGMNFEEAIKLFDITPESAIENNEKIGC